MRHPHQRRDPDVDDAADEIRRLRSCINDLISVLALPALWSGSDSSQVVGTLLDVLLAMQRLDFACARLSDSSDGPPIQVVRWGHRQDPSVHPRHVLQALDRCLTGDQAASRFVARDPAGEGEVSIASFSLGLQHEIGVLAVGSRRPDFPTDVERLLLRVAANQAAIGLQEALRAGEQKRVAEALERRVAERTRQLTAVNDDLRRSQAYLAEAQRLSRTGSFGWRISTGEILWSEETFRIFQYDPGTTPTVDRILQRVHAEDAALVRQTIERATQDGEDFEHEYRLVMPDGSVKHVHVVAQAMSDEAGGLEFAGAVMDVTAAIKADEAMRQAQEDLAHVSRVTTLGEMAASIAHEVDQPLSGVVINANACLRFLAGESPNLDEVRDGLQAIARDGRRASEVTARIRTLARRTPSEKQPLDINAVVSEVIAIAEGEARRTRAKVRTELAGNLPRVLGDPVQLQQVVLNLLLNGLDAMGAVDDRPRELVIRTDKEEADRVRVAVRDSGTGIDPEYASRMFEAFHSTKRGGLGMGLSISRTIVERHGGRLWARLNDGPGTTFYFTV
jgi:C4-dicarboxylate-specific signal transduction histidine kinase